MIGSDVVGDLDGRDLIWLTILGNVLREPVALTVLAARLQTLVLSELDGSPRHISRCLHEMQRGGHIVLTDTGERWQVSLGSKGRDTFERLMRARPLYFARRLNEVACRIRAGFADLAASTAA